MAYSTAAAVGSGEEGGADFVSVAAYAAAALQTSTAAWKNQWRGGCSRLRAAARRALLVFTHTVPRRGYLTSFLAAGAVQGAAWGRLKRAHSLAFKVRTVCSTRKQVHSMYYYVGYPGTKY